MAQAMVTLDMIEAARERLKGVAQRTAIMQSTSISQRCGCEVYLKMENFQRTGSFKLRGAYNKVASLTNEERALGIVASSAGNHAQGVALAAKEYGCKATICMPSNAPLSKVEATLSYGADVVLAGDFYADAYEEACRLQKEKGYTFCHPFDDPVVIAGQGTIGLEILDEVPDADVIIVPVGGGGLIAGVAAAVKAIRPSIRVIGVQTANMPSMQASIAEGHLVTVPANKSLADGIAVGTPGTLTFQLVEDYVDEVVTVTESEIAESILFLLERVKTAVEGAGACPVAAMINDKIDGLAGKKVVALVSGGNIDVNMIDRIINNGLVQSWRRIYLDVIVQDRPHVLSTLTGLISDTNANILSIWHDRSQRDIEVGYVHVALEIETMGEKHVKNLQQKLIDHGFPAVLK
ncbi:threonine ammonia-lyase [uncultured Veillonella sp.]|uniref:threonine ammonia-lyase n=1 Tax=uncultured Veillonella sp. TaxID=159268 RepID=UPI0025D78A9E|nr:threonine ammonia-lyase [uncultured Veillonella sp.]MDY3973091.1 threonine ammonia-lyase [Veillonella caviae]